MSILDASVVLKWFVEEDKSNKAREIQDEYFNGKITIAVPDLLLSEIANALRFNSSFDAAEIGLALDNLSHMGLEIIPTSFTLVGSAVKLAYKHNLSVYDAIYVSLALELSQNLITADKKLFEKVKDLHKVQLL